MGINGVKGIGDMKIAEIRNLSYSYRENCGQKKAVLNVSFDIDEGECLGLIGESGSGKSTIGSLIGNFLTGYEGSIHLMSNEKELADMSKKERHDLYRDIQVVFQNPWQSFPPNMCVGEGIAEGIRYYSRGLAFGRAIIRSPRLLICDEVTSALDVSIQAQIMQLLFSLKKEMGMAMLFISHDLALVGGICDRVCVLHDGQLVEELPGGREMYEKAEHPYTRLLMKSVLDII